MKNLDRRFRNRPAPDGWDYVSRDKVRPIWHDHEHWDICIHMNNTNVFHIFDGWNLGWEPSIQMRRDNDFDSSITQYCWYQDRELGTYPVFLVRRRKDGDS